VIYNNYVQKNRNTTDRVTGDLQEAIYTVSQKTVPVLFFE